MLDVMDGSTRLANRMPLKVPSDWTTYATPDGRLYVVTTKTNNQESIVFPGQAQNTGYKARYAWSFTVPCSNLVTIYPNDGRIVGPSGSILTSYKGFAAFSRGSGFVSDVWVNPLRGDGNGVLVDDTSITSYWEHPTNYPALGWSADPGGITLDLGNAIRNLSLANGKKISVEFSMYASFNREGVFNFAHDHFGLLCSYNAYDSSGAQYEIKKGLLDDLKQPVDSQPALGIMFIRPKQIFSYTKTQNLTELVFQLIPCFCTAYTAESYRPKHIMFCVQVSTQV